MNKYQKLGFDARKMEGYWGFGPSQIKSMQIPKGEVRKYDNKNIILAQKLIFKKVDSILDFEEIETPFGIVKKVKFRGNIVCYDEDMLPFKLYDGRLLFNIFNKKETILGDIWEVRVESMKKKGYLNEKGEVFRVNGKEVTYVGAIIATPSGGKIQSIITKNGNHYFINENKQIIERSVFLSRLK